MGATPELKEGSQILEGNSLTLKVFKKRL